MFMLLFGILLIATVYGVVYGCQFLPDESKFVKVKTYFWGEDSDYDDSDY